MEKGKCMLKLWWKIIYLAALGTLILNTYTMVHMDSSQRRLWKSKIRMIEKIEQEHPQDVGTVEVWDGEKKRVYYGLVTIGNERMVLMIKVALIVLGFAAGAACAAVEAAAFQQEKYRN